MFLKNLNRMGNIPESLVYTSKQECIPVGCVPWQWLYLDGGRGRGEGEGVSGQGVSTLWGGFGWGGCLLPGVGVWSGGSAPGEVSGPEGGVWSRGGCLLQEGVWSGGCLLQGGVCSWGVSGLGGCLFRGGGWGQVVSEHALRQTPPPPCGQTDACKNITFATSFRTVIICY